MRPMLALLLLGCNPQDAEVEGTWTVWLAANSSTTVDRDNIDLENASRVDCSRTEEEVGYIGNSDGAPDCETVEALTWQTWLQDDGIYTISEALTPWRSDALINGEGDFQLTLHQDIGSGEDFRIAFSIDPDFSPTVCTTDDGGNLQLEYVDGSNWLEQWSADEGDYTIYYLNAGGYQVNPGNSEEYWSFATDWLSGFGIAKFSDDDFYSYGVDYLWSDPNYPVYFTDDEGDTYCTPWSTIDEIVQSDDNRRNDNDQASYANTRLFYWESWYNPYCEDLPSTRTADGYRDAIAEELVASTQTWSDEMVSVYGADSMEFRVEDNSWREIDDARQGLDGWIDVHTSWVRIKKGSKLEVGGSAEGDFQIYFYGAQSGSHALVSGTFKVAEIKDDRWAYEDLESVKREENGTEYCGGATIAQ